MARTDTPIFRNVNITSTRRESVHPDPVGPTVRKIGVTLDRAGFNDSSGRVITMGLQSSLDNMATWQDWCEFTDTDMTHTLINGGPLVRSSFVCTAPPAGARVKGYAFTNGRTVRQDIYITVVD